MIPFKNNVIENVYMNFDESSKSSLLAIRELIYKVADRLNKSGIPVKDVQESLKWGQPSYSVKTGSPIRLYIFDDNKIGIFVHCQTNLIETFKTIFQDDLNFEKNRAIILNPNEKLPIKELEVCIELALTYHYNKTKK